MRKIPSRLRGTNFCTSSAHFAPSFVRQPSGPECTQIVQNTPKHQFRVQWCGSDAFVAKNSDATSFTNFCTVRPVFHRVSCGNQTVPNAPKRYETHQNVSLGSNGWIGCVRCKNFRRDFVARTFALVRPCFPPSFVRQLNGPEYTQMVRNSPKH